MRAALTPKAVAATPMEMARLHRTVLKTRVMGVLPVKIKAAEGQGDKVICRVKSACTQDRQQEQIGLGDNGMGICTHSRKNNINHTPDSNCWQVRLITV